MNSHNIDSLMKYYNDDVVFDIPELSTNLTGKEALRGIAEYDSVLNTIMSIFNITLMGDSVFCELTETNDWLNLAGISTTRYSDALFVVKDGRISYIRAELSDSSAVKINAVLDSLIPWANQNHPEELAEILPEGVFVYNADNAVTSLALLQEWRQAIEGEKPGK